MALMPADAAVAVKVPAPIIANTDANIPALRQSNLVDRDI